MTNLGASLDTALAGSILIATEAHVSSRTTDAALDAYGDARIAGLRSALAILAVMSILALFLAQRIPTKQPGSI